ncbi:PLP-dependent aminotransferase family protein [Xenorhabdus hominickii]|uniref:GntR family transcriptional regulator n=1 Tax=Xenorhabdus hominickii TaxID=351679 RepID=A0A2G0QE74_XENHO|nr:PLP-dependent aminotransferase family protein [Xenorhabdus hominickii]PHM57533.1 GntR family transcriptional regulator [Xenorhabdus hominickii]
MKTTIFQADEPLQHNTSLPLYRQIYQRFIQAITQGILQPDQRVPSIRALSSELRVSRSTVESAYTRLIEEGYLEAKGQAGTVVSSQLTGIPLKSPAILLPPEPEVDHLSLFDSAALTQPLTYQLGLPALDLFPRKLWNTLTTKHIRLQSRHLFYPQSTGYPPLQEAIASYLQLSRGVICVPKQIFITAGYRDALNLIGRALLKPKDQIWLEDPCFPPGYHLLTQMGAEIVPIPVDQHGICVSLAQERAPNARLALGDAHTSKSIGRLFVNGAQTSTFGMGRAKPCLCDRR